MKIKKSFRCKIAMYLALVMILYAVTLQGGVVNIYAETGYGQSTPSDNETHEGGGSEGETVSYSSISENQLKSISVSGQLERTEYDHGDTLDMTGVTIWAHYFKGEDKDVTSDVKIEKLTAGDTEVKVTYQEGDITKSDVIKGIKVDKAVPDIGEVSYTGAPLYDTTSVSAVTLTWSNQKIEGLISLTSDSLSANVTTYQWKFEPDNKKYYKNSEGIITLTVTANYMTALGKAGEMSSKEYIYGEKLNFTGLEFIAYYLDGSNKKVSAEALTYTQPEAGQTSINVSYEGAVCEISGLTIHRATPSYEIPTGLKAVCGDSLSSVTLPEGFTWEDSTQKLNAGDDEDGQSVVCRAIYTPADQINYEKASVDIPVFVNHELAISSNHDGKTHALKCAHCDYAAASQSCSGGKATCVSKAKCAVCGDEYGTLDASNHAAELKYHKSVKETCTEDGSSAYWQCESCGKCYNDAKGMSECEKSGLVIKAHHTLTHVPAKKATSKKAGSKEYYDCTACGKYFSDEGKTEIKKNSWIIPYVKKTVTVELGKKLKLSQIMNGISAFEKMTLSNASKYKKYFTVNGKNGTITTKKYYKKKIKNTIPVKISAAGKVYTVKVKIVIPAPKVTISRAKLIIGGKDAYQYKLKYDIKNATKIKVRVLPGCVSDSTRKAMNNYFDSKTAQSKGVVWFRVMKTTLNKSKIKFQVVAYYGDNQSEAVVIEK